MSRYRLEIYTDRSAGSGGEDRYRWRLWLRGRQVAGSRAYATVALLTVELTEIFNFDSSRRSGWLALGAGFDLDDQTGEGVQL